MPDLPSAREEIASRIRSLRRARELSIQALAKAAEMSPGYLSEVERGQSAISGEKLARIAKELGVAAGYLLSGESDDTNTSIHIPTGLSEAAKVLDLTFAQTVRLLAGKESLIAKRSRTVEDEWTKDEWVEFYNKVKLYL